MNMIHFVLSLVLTFLPIYVAQKVTCSKGSFVNNGICELCPKGTYQFHINATECIPCPQGTYNPLLGAQGLDICIQCPEGTFQDRLGAIAKEDCKPCPFGENAPAGAPSCTSCPPGTFISLCEVESPRFPLVFNGTCSGCSFSRAGDLACDEGSPFRSRCTACQPNETSEKNSVECETCPSGMFRLPGSPDCRPKKCPPGTGISFTNECSECVRFRFNDGSQEQCNDCPPGKRGNRRDGATSCIQIPEDEFFDSSLFEFVKCEQGKSSVRTKGQFCLPDDFGCPSNFFQNKNGICEACPFQTRLDEKQKTCVPCPENHLSIGGTATTCTSCPPGMIAPEDISNIESVQCICRPGFGFVEGSNAMKCEKCKKGTSSNGRTSCQVCSLNTFAALRGSAECTRCPDGTFQPNKGASSCMSRTCDTDLITSNEGECVVPATGCPPNTRREQGNEFPGEVLCQAMECPSGTVLMSFEGFFNTVIFCGDCGKNERFVKRNSSCVRCMPNEFSVGGLSEVCKKCPSGQVFSSFYDRCGCFDSRQLKNGRCQTCPKGTYGFSNVEGCKPCPAGTASDVRGAFFCTKCTAGTFSKKSGSQTCTKCTNGTRSFGPGNTKCA